ncbi:MULTISPECIES: RES family NAD+ phosphorylase [Acidiphilium]|nr:MULTISPECIES: RES domain-containing protein [Acidiphilium]
MRLQTIVYRAHNPRWAWAPNSGAGAATHGGRFNPVGIKALYTSRTFQTAWLEAQQGFPYKAQPMTLCGYDVDCETILDLTDKDIRAASNVTLDDLGCAWKDLATRKIEPPSWAMMKRLAAGGVAGIIVQSFAIGATASDVNVIFWEWGDVPPCQVKVIDDAGRLPKNMSSWT